MDPHTGRLLAMTGGYNYAESEFNRSNTGDAPTWVSL